VATVKSQRLLSFGENSDLVIHYKYNLYQQIFSSFLIYSGRFGSIFFYICNYDLTYSINILECIRGKARGWVAKIQEGNADI
jgi:hypothetical protein